ncbi:MAG TPA: sigma-70 family RNA polymerase sigma factor, partial [Armatimonadota bacterium]|nr:sigma-70 family RNA polymerase sigma factor [Armatimonadota bacterium]
MSALLERTDERTRGELDRLLRACTRGDADAWERMLAEVRKSTLELARWRYRLAYEDAEDVAQMAQVRLMQRLGQLRDSGAFSLWLRRLVHSSVMDFLRSRKQPGLSLDDPESGAELLPELCVDSGFDQILLRADVDRALARLPRHYREPIRMHVLEGLPQDEVSRLLGRPRSTIAS